MALFSATLERDSRPDEIAPAQVEVADGRLTVSTDTGRLGTWSVTELRLADRLDRFRLTTSTGERITVSVADSDLFWEKVDRAGASEPRWWKFWTSGAWRTWRSRRKPWVEYRQRKRQLDHEIAATTRRRDHLAEELSRDRRHLTWVENLSSRPLPIRTAKSEPGLATVAGVTLLEPRSRQGQAVWTPVDSGAVHFTDRRMVFSGKKNVEFRYDKLTAVDAGTDGLHVAVSSRKRDHILTGPTEQLSVLLDAARALARGDSPRERLADAVARTQESKTAEEDGLRALESQRSGLAAPPRPLSPAWVPTLMLVAIFAVLGSGADPVIEDALAAPATTQPPATAPPTLASPPTTAVVTTTSAPTTTTSSSSTTTTVPEPTTTVAAAAPVPDVDGEMMVSFFDVGQGDSALVAGPDFTILIDAGRHDRSDVVPHLRQAGVEEIDLLVGTHPHADHVGQFPEVLAAFPVTEVWMSGDVHTTATFERAIDAIAASDAGYHEPRAGESYEIGSALVEVVSPTETSGDLNNGSIALRVRYGEVTFLFTGDAEAPAEAAMLAGGADLSANVLHVGHHGSSTSTTARFLDAVAPAAAVYSAGAGNQYGHPHPEVIERLADRGVEVYGTDIHGTVVVTTDGSRISVSTGGATAAVAEPATTTTPPTTTTTTTTTAPPPEDTSACQPGQVDINRAGFDELQRIIHIGPDRAGQILDLRPFSSVDSMTRIKGIAEKRLADIKAEGIACVG